MSLLIALGMYVNKLVPIASRGNHMHPVSVDDGIQVCTLNAL